MAISTDIKIGFQGEAVKRGLAGIAGQFQRMTGGMKSALREVRIGAARAVGGGLADLALKAVTLVPDQIEAMRQLSNEYGLLARATGTSEESLLRLTKALELAGLEGTLAVDAVREMQTKMGEAIRGPSEARQALKDIGGDHNLFRGSVLDNFQRLANITESFSGETRDLAFAFDRLFGGDLGAKLLPFFRDYGKWMTEAGYSSDGFGAALRRNREALQLQHRVFAVMKRKFQEGLLAGIEGGDGFGTSAILKQLIRYVEGIDVSKLGAVFQRVMKAGVLGFEWFVGAVNESGRIMPALKEAFSGLGNVLREIIRDGIKMGLKEGFSFWNFMKPSLPFTISKPAQSPPSGSSGETTSIGKKLDQLISVNTTGNRSLSKIERSGFPAVWA